MLIHNITLIKGNGIMKKHYIFTLLLLSFFLTTLVQAYDWKEESAAKKQAIRYFGLVKHYMDEKHRSYKNPSIKYYSHNGITVKGWGSFEPIIIDKKEEISYGKSTKTSLYDKVFFVDNEPVEIHAFIGKDLMVKFFLDDKKRELLTYRHSERDHIKINRFYDNKFLDSFYCDGVCYIEHYAVNQFLHENKKNDQAFKPIIQEIEWVNEFLGVKAGESYRDQDAMKLYEQYAPIKDKYLQDIKKEHNNISIKYFIDWHDPKSYFDSAVNEDKLGKEVSHKEALQSGIYTQVTFIDSKPIFQEAFSKDKNIMKRYFDEKGRMVFRIDYDDAKEDAFAIFKFRDNDEWMDFIYCHDEQCIVDDHTNLEPLKPKQIYPDPGEIVE